MNLFAEDRGAVDDNDDLDEGLPPVAIPVDEDIQEGDEANHRETDLPPAMPPGA